MKGSNFSLYLFPLYLLPLIAFQATSFSLGLWPEPHRYSFNPQALPLQFSICDLSFKIVALPPDYVQAALDIYIGRVFGCHQPYNGGNGFVLTIKVRDPTRMVAERVEDEKYELTIRQTQQWELIADYYVGFLRGLETFSQLLDKQPNGNYLIHHPPILIDDQPQFLWRGLMIDTSRHYFPVSHIKHTIDGMLFSKLNVLHWHIVDQDSFPMQILSRPGLEQWGRVGGSYSQKQIREVIEYARVRGVRVVPEIDSPAHTLSWGRSPELANISKKCHNEYSGQFDPSLDLTYEVIRDVMNETTGIFADDYIHLGGDEAQLDCWESHPHIIEFMRLHNISTLEGLQVYYRERQKEILRSLSGKKAIYWANEEINLPVQQDDVIQWWGESANVEQLKERKNPIILSYYDIAYLDTGFGDELGDQYRTYIRWPSIYLFEPNIPGMNILGGEACIWSELTAADNFDQKTWPRAAVLAERLWNSRIRIEEWRLSVAERLMRHARRLKERGFKPEPVTVGLCEINPTICFS